MLLGVVSARTGGASVGRSVVRITVWGMIAMGVSALVGYLFDVQL